MNALEIGIRIRNLREETFGESRQLFAERCELSVNNLCKLENGQIKLSSNALTKICLATGANADYILFGKDNYRKNSIRGKIENYLTRCTEDELRTFYIFISTIKGPFGNTKK